MQTKKANMKVLQANLHRSKTADALLDQIMLEKEADIAIISEQYLTPKNGIWLEDISKTAAIWIPQYRRITVVDKGFGNGFVWITTNEFSIVSCYLTPSDRIEDFRTKVNSLEDKLRDLERLVIGGDFNSKAIEWGSTFTNSRGRYILDMAARIGLVVANVGDTSTFSRPGCEGTIPDITLISEGIYNKVFNWKVLEDFTGSDHNYISFSVEDSPSNNRANTYIGTRRWDLASLNPNAFLSYMDQTEAVDIDLSNARALVCNTMNIIQRACDASMRKVGTKVQKKAVYWWTNAIAELRKDCLRCRRRYTRARRNGDAIEEANALKTAKKALKGEIKRSKKQKWEELRRDLNNNPWGLGYKIVLKKLGAQTKTPDLPEQVMRNIVHALFPSHEKRKEDEVQIPETPPTPFTRDELKAAVVSLKNHKAPGPDGIPTEILKLIEEKHSDLLLNMYNACLKEGIFPEVWKCQKLVLISKGKGDPTSPSSYRPLCMLDTAGKLLERLIKPRLQQAIQNSGGLSKRQYGFRPKMSTIGALQDVIDATNLFQRGNHYSRRIVLLATLDVRNAFNSARWTDMIKALEERFKCPAYILRMIRSYLKDRKLIYSAGGIEYAMNVTSGAAQGSILGPELWNICYDEILTIDMPPETYLVGYADDIAAVIAARNMKEVQIKLNQVMLRTKSWLSSHGLDLATEKTDLLIITRKHIPLNVEMQVLTERITTRETIKYLGLWLDSRLNFTDHIRNSAMKASKVAASLSRLMANIGGPLQSKRRLIMSTVHSILLYGSEIWAASTENECRRKILAKVQRTAALRVSSAYRTVSEEAILVISKAIPIDLLAKERKKIWDLRKSGQIPNITCLRSQTIHEWQMKWNEESQGKWTARLIPDIDKWYENDGESNYYLTQFLSGHGYFCKYLYRIGKTESPLCIYCGDCIDDAEHTFFECKRWGNERNILKQQINVNILEPENISNIMTASSENWKYIAAFVESLLRMKKRDLDSVQHRR